MKTKNLENILFWLQSALLIFMSLLVALLLSRQTVDSSVLKTSWSLGLSFFIFIVFLLRTSLYKNFQLSKLEVIILVFWAWLMFNGLFISKYRSESMHQMFKFTSYILIFFATSEMAMDKKFRTFFNYFMISLAGILITYGMMQKWNLDIFQWEGASSSRRILSTFGNSIFYANFLLFILPIIFVNLTKEILDELRSKKATSNFSYLTNLFFMLLVLVTLGFFARKLAFAPGKLSVAWHKWGILILVGLYFIINHFMLKFLKRSYIIIYLLTMSIFGTFSLVFTLSRGAWLGFIPMVFYIAIWLAYYLVKEKFIKISFGKLLFFSLIGIILFMTIIVFTVPESVKSRMRNIKLSSTTVQVRFTIWKGALKMIRKKPITGFGTGTFQLNFPKYRPRNYSIKTVSNNTINTHSEYLQISANAGLIGLFIFLFIAFYVIFANIGYLKKVKGETNFFFALMLGSTVIAVLIHSLWSVSMRFTSTVVFFYIYLGLFSGMLKEAISNNRAELKVANSQDNMEKKLEKGTHSQNSAFKHFNIIFFIALIILMFFAKFWIISSDRFYKRDFFVRQGMLKDEIRGYLRSERGQILKYSNTLNQMKDKDQKRRTMEYILKYYDKFDKYWYSKRLQSLDSRALSVLKIFFNRLERLSTNNSMKGKYFLMYYRIKKMSAGKLKSDEYISLLNDLDKIFQKNYSDKKLQFYKKYLNIMVDWMLYIVECENTKYPQGFNELLQQIRARGNAGVYFDQFNKTYFTNFYSNLDKGFSAKTVLYYNFGLLTDYYTYDCHYKKASALFDLKKYNFAMDAYKELEKIAPNYTQLHYNKGVVYRKIYEVKGKKDAELLRISINELENSKALNPYFINTRMILASDYQDNKELKKAEKEFQFSYKYSYDTVKKFLASNKKGLGYKYADLLKEVQIFVSTAMKLERFYNDDTSLAEFKNKFHKEKTDLIIMFESKISEFKTSAYKTNYSEKRQKTVLSQLQNLKYSLIRIKN
ncbi:O-antigen ligase family protein [bacterium]|nr:O-antigen ligase family protein [bacterium]